MDYTDFVDELQLAASELESDCFLLWLLENEECSPSMTGYGLKERAGARDLLYRTLSEHVVKLADLTDRAAKFAVAAGEAIT